VVGASDDDLVLDCYRLARFYHQAPQIFLALPLGEIELHMARTGELVKSMRSSESGDSAD
jgi:hypothetical protein